MNTIQKIGLFASVALPLFNIPLMLRLLSRKTSEDLSLIWVLGVWVCLILMTPAGLISTDLIFRIFTVVNLAFFSGVTYLTLRYRKGARPCAPTATTPSESSAANPQSNSRPPQSL